MTGPTAAKGRFPYPHRTVAEVDALKTCSACRQQRSTACRYRGCEIPAADAWERAA